MSTKVFLAAAIASLLVGCVAMPMTADEFREEVKKSSFGKVETLEVNRPVAEVGRTLQRKAADCLNYKLTSTPTMGSGAAPGSARAELDVQVQASGNVAKAPPGGNYLLVAVAEPVGRDRTRMEIYRGAGAPIAQAVRAWASGDERGCPDPKRTFDR
jgi:hypothetical protein